MSVANSNLAIFNKEICNVDMVCSVSLKSINAQMRAYLMSLNDSKKQKKVKMFIMQTTKEGVITRYVVSPDSKDEELPEQFSQKLREYTSLYQELDKLDLFSPKPKTENIATASKTFKVKYALYLEDGIPDAAVDKMVENAGVPGFDPDSVIKPMDLLPDEGKVLFRQFFRNIVGVQLNISVNEDDEIEYTCVNSRQPDNAIWYFPCSIPLDFRATTYKKMLAEGGNDDIIDKIRNMSEVTNPDDVFQISQLSLDLSKLSTLEKPTIRNLDHDIDGIMGVMISEYFDRLEKGGQTVFGYVVNVNKESTKKYLFTPQKKNFHISDKTIDYLIGFERTGVIPNLSPYKDFPWANEKDPMLSRAMTADAAMAISACYLIGFIKNMVEPVLQNLCIRFHPSASYSYKKSRFEYEMDVNRESKKAMFTQNGTRLDYSFADDGHSGKVLGALCFTSTRVTTEYRADVTGEPGVITADGIRYPSFNFRFRLTGWANIEFDEHDNKGRFFDRIINMNIGIQLDENGNINFIKQISDEDQHPGGINCDWLSEFISFGTIDNYVNKVRDPLSRTIEEIKNYSIDQFTRSVDSQVGWVMPGCKTFTFKYDTTGGNVNAFSPAGDFYTYANYVQEQA